MVRRFMSIGGGDMKQKVALAWLIFLILALIGVLVYKAIISTFFFIIMTKVMIALVFWIMTIWAIYTITLE